MQRGQEGESAGAGQMRGIFARGYALGQVTKSTREIYEANWERLNFRNWGWEGYSLQHEISVGRIRVMHGVITS